MSDWHAPDVGSVKWGLAPAPERTLKPPAKPSRVLDECCGKCAFYRDGRCSVDPKQRVVLPSAWCSKWTAA